MGSFRTYLRKLVADIVFLRVVLILLSAPLFWVALLGAVELGTFRAGQWYLWLLIAGFGGVGLVLAGAGILGREALVKKVGGNVDPGAAEWLWLVFAVLVVAFALPVTAVIRFFFPAKGNERERL